MAEHYTGGTDEGRFDRDVDDARKLHHLATADPELDGTLTGPAHEKKYGLERHDDSVANWRSVGVHEYENRALVGDEDGAENLRGAASDSGPVLAVEDNPEAGAGGIRTASADKAPENASAPRASDSSSKS